MARREDRRALWDARHAAADGPAAPEPFLAHALQCLARLGAGPGRAIDLACGTGRHALALAELGFEVEGWDASPVALARMEARASARGLAVRTRAVDLEDEQARERALAAAPPGALVVCVDFLHRPLLAALPRLLAPGGHALVSTFTTDRAGEHPREAFCLAPFELARGLPSCTTVLVEEAGGRAGLLARRR